MTGKEVGRSRGRGGRTVEGAQGSGESHPALRERIFTLSAAILRINASLDMGSVLRDAGDNARTFTTARYGAVAAVDRAGEPRDYLTSGRTGCGDPARRFRQGNGAEGSQGPPLGDVVVGADLRPHDLARVLRDGGRQDDRNPGRRPQVPANSRPSSPGIMMSGTTRFTADAWKGLSRRPKAKGLRYNSTAHGRVLRHSVHGFVRSLNATHPRPVRHTRTNGPGSRIA